MSAGRPDEPAELLSVILPAYNEASAIADVLGDVRRALDRLPCASEVVVVDDGSRDETAALATAAGVRVVRNPVNLGYGHSLLRGIAVARGNLIAISDADGTYPAAALADLYGLIQRGVDHAIGQRTGEHLSTRWPGRKVYRWLCGYVVGCRVPDANSGLRMFRREVVQGLRGDLCLGFSFTTSLTLASFMSGHVVAFCEISYARRRGRSHVRFRDVLRTVQYLFQLVALYNPLKLFLPITAAAVIAALVAFATGAAGLWSHGLLAGVLMSGASLLLIGLAAHAYILSRSGLRPVLMLSEPRLVETGSDQRPPPAPAGPR